MFLGDDLFLRTASINVDASVIGVGRSRWKAAKADTKIEAVVQVMCNNRFDVLPIDEAPDLPIYEYFHTKKWNQWDRNSIEKDRINYQDLIPATTGILELIDRFVRDKKLFYFLTYHSRIVGLVSVANLNSREVNFYLFAMVCEFETRLAKLVRQSLTESDIKSELDEISLKAFEQDRKQGFENDIVQYLYLSSLLNIVRTLKLHESLGYTSKKQFEKLNSLVDFRNQVAHPVRSLVTDETSLKKLSERIDKLQDVLFRLRQLQGAI